MFLDQLFVEGSSLRALLLTANSRKELKVAVTLCNSVLDILINSEDAEMPEVEREYFLTLDICEDACNRLFELEGLDPTLDLPVKGDLTEKGRELIKFIPVVHTLWTKLSRVL